MLNSYVYNVFFIVVLDIVLFLLFLLTLQLYTRYGVVNPTYGRLHAQLKRIHSSRLDVSYKVTLRKYHTGKMKVMENSANIAYDHSVTLTKTGIL